MKRRVFKAAGILFLFLCAGLLIPCPIRLITGFKCPGCGVTHMCAALLRLDISAAFAANPMILLLSPVLVAFFLPAFWGYLKTGRFCLGHVQNIVVWICIFLLLAFGAVRNILPGL